MYVTQHRLFGGTISLWLALSKLLASVTTEADPRPPPLDLDSLSDHQRRDIGLPSTSRPWPAAPRWYDFGK